MCSLSWAVTVFHGAVFERVCGMLEKISIRAKIIAAFAVVLGSTIALGLFAGQRLDALDKASGEIRRDYLPSTRVLGEIAYNTMRFRQLEATDGLAPDAEARAGEEASLHRVQEQTRKTFEAYWPLVSGGEEQQLADQLKQEWAEYLGLDARYLALLRADDLHGAVAAYRGEMRTLFNKFQDALQADIELNNRQANEVSDHGSELGASARIWILSVLVLTAALCVGSGWFLIRGISAPLRQMTSAMRRLADGDLATEIPAGDRKDEVGQMARAMLVFKDNALKARELQAAADKTHGDNMRRHAAMERHTQDFGSAAAGVMASLARSATAIRETATEMSQAAQRTHERAASTADGSAAAAANLAAVAAAAEEMSASINEISQQVTRATQAAQAAVQRASATDAKVTSMAALADRIGDVVKLITDIAGQTWR
jgi:methyl-accepting chemotaxis protein